MNALDEKIVEPLEISGELVEVNNVPITGRFNKILVKSRLHPPSHFGKGRAFLQVRPKPSPTVGNLGWRMLTSGTELTVTADNPIDVTKEKSFEMAVSSTAVTGHYELQLVLVSNRTGMCWTCEPTWIVVAKQIPKVPEKLKTQRRRKKRESNSGATKKSASSAS